MKVKQYQRMKVILNDDGSIKAKSVYTEQDGLKTRAFTAALTQREADNWNAQCFGVEKDTEGNTIQQMYLPIEEEKAPVKKTKPKAEEKTDLGETI